MRLSRLLCSVAALGGLALSAGAIRAASPADQKLESEAAIAAAPAAKGALVPVFRPAVRFDVSPPLRSLKPLKASELSAPRAGGTRERFVRNRPLPTQRAGEKTEESFDAALDLGVPEPLIPAPTIQWEGQSNLNNFAIQGFLLAPPDTNGDVGPNHYVQAVNLLVAVYAKNTGALVAGPFKISTQVFGGFGGACEAGDDGDPIVLYDQLADRWLLSQFALPNFPNPPWSQCTAISTSGDPTGTWFRYEHQMPNNKLNDYPHFGVWPTAYFMTDNQFLPPAFPFAGGGAFAFDRNGMLVGNPTAGFIYFDLELLDPNIGGMLPADSDGPIPPPAGMPGIFTYFTAGEFGDPQGDGLRLFNFTPNFANPGASTFVERAGSPLPVAAFDPDLCAAARERCIPQPGTAVQLEAISDRLMHRVAYRNFSPTRGSLILSHTVDGDGAGRAGVRWYELRAPSPNGTFVVQDQGTYAPGAVHRWMGSAAMDGAGNIGVGFSYSSGAVFPSIAYAGRLAADPPGTLNQGEANVIVGTGSQTGNNRWGDYSAMSIDPSNDCELWYTQEYFTNAPGCPTPGWCWQTRVASFNMGPATCTAAVPGRITGFVRNTSGVGIEGATVATNTGYSDATDYQGRYTIMNVPAGTYTVTASKAGYNSATSAGVVVAAGGTTVRNFVLTGASSLVFEYGAGNDTVIVGGNGSGAIDFQECVGVTVGLRNIGAGTATGVTGTLTTSTPHVVVRQNSSGYPDIPGGAVRVNNTLFQISTSPLFVAGTTINLTLTVNTNLQAGVTYTFPFTLPSGSTISTSFTANGPVPIPDLGTAFLDVPVSGITSPVTKVTAKIYLTHTWDSDLEISLLSPAPATTVILSNRRGGSGDNFGTDCPPSANDTTFDDAATTPIASGVAPFVGTFRPDQPLSAFNGLSGAGVNGTWRLRVVDLAAADVGNIFCVTITINGLTSTSGGCSLRGDFNRNAHTDILFRHSTSGENVIWYFNDTAFSSGQFTNPFALVDANWQMAGTNDFNNDTRTDILWRHDVSGQNVVWYMDNHVLTGGTFLTPEALADVNWKMAGTGDFNQDDSPDIAFRHQVSGQIVVWYMTGSVMTGGGFTTPDNFDTNYRLVGVADFNGDLKPDLLWQHQTTGELQVWYMDNLVRTAFVTPTPSGDPNPDWDIVAVGDYNRDKWNDIVWRNASNGDHRFWTMNGVTRIAEVPFMALADLGWKIVGPR